MIEKKIGPRGVENGVTRPRNHDQMDPNAYLLNHLQLCNQHAPFLVSHLPIKF